ncbi:hypothetical protein [Streptomyces avermitilis]|uniref:hypothetical protein n=1 Tax=Streptomyces avermitilis TaxID=33903 RepID=UPI00368343BA
MEAADFGVSVDDFEQPAPTPERERDDEEMHGTEPVLSSAIVQEHVAATDAFRSAARWLVAVSGAIAAVLVAGLQLTSLGSLTGGRLSAAVTLFLIALASVGYILLRAARVLAPTAQTLAELREIDIAEVRRQAEGAPKGLGAAAKRLLYGPDFKLSEAVSDFRHALENYGLQTLDEIYLLYTGRTPVRIAQEIRAGKPRLSRNKIESVAQQLISFIELRETQHRYQLLVRALVPAGLVASLAIVFFALAASPDPDPKVSRPLHVVVIFTSSSDALKKSLLEGCAGQTRQGTAVAGTLREPEVLLQPKKLGDRCSGRHIIKPALGIVSYK